MDNNYSLSTVCATLCNKDRMAVLLFLMFHSKAEGYTADEIASAVGKSYHWTICCLARMRDQGMVKYKGKKRRFFLRRYRADDEDLQCLMRLIRNYYSQNQDCSRDNNLYTYLSLFSSEPLCSITLAIATSIEDHHLSISDIRNGLFTYITRPTTVRHLKTLAKLGAINPKTHLISVKVIPLDDLSPDDPLLIQFVSICAYISNPPYKPLVRERWRDTFH